MSKELLTKLKKIKIKNYTIKDVSNKDELIRYKTSLASKYALSRIEKFLSLIENLSKTEKLCILKEAQNGFSHSIRFYSQAGLFKESKKTMKYYDTLTLVINSQESKMPAGKSSVVKLILSPNKNSW